jgi:hypothetical protein
MKIALCATAALAALALGSGAEAQNLVQNGNFSNTTGGVGGLGQFFPAGGTGNNNSAYAISIADWNTPDQHAPFLFVVNPTTLDSTGFPDSWDNSFPQLWGSNNGGNDIITASPTGGPNALLMDADYDIAPIYQVIATSQLTVGDKYTVSFEWAAGQWSGRDGPTTEGIEIGLGGNVQQVARVNPVTGTDTFALGSHDFSGWMSYSATFVYNGNPSDMTYAYDEGGATFDAAANWLTFIAEGSPQGLPPTLLVTGINLVQVPNSTPTTPNPGVGLGVPEPASWALMIAGAGALGFALRRRRSAAMAARGA